MTVYWNADRIVAGGRVHDANSTEVFGEVVESVKATRTVEIKTRVYPAVNAAGIANAPDAVALRNVQPVLIAAMANSSSGEFALFVDQMAACDGKRRFSAQIVMSAADEPRRAPIDDAVGEQSGDDIVITVGYVERSVGPP
ncbi:MAG: hypothetical protein AB7V43_14950 [Acidimicrobiia bacterium]